MVRQYATGITQMLIPSFIHRYLTELIAYAESFQDGQLLLQHDNYQVLV